MDALEIFNFSRYLQWSGSVIIAVACLPHFNTRGTPIKILGVYAITSIVFSLFQEISVQVFANVGINNIGNAFVFSEALLFGLLYLNATKSRKFRNLVVVTISLYCIVYLFAFLFFEHRSYSLIRTSRDLLMLLLALTYFYYLIQKLPEENLLRFPMFWINVAVIFFFSGTFFLSFMVDYLVSVLKNDLAGFWAFRNVFRFSFCLVLAYSGWLDWPAKER